MNNVALFVWVRILIIGIASGKGGVGKTSFSVNLALALKMYSVDILLIDGDLTTGSVSLAVGSPFPKYYIQDYFRKGKSIENVVFNHPLGIKLIASSISVDSVKEYPLKTSLKKWLSKRKEFVIVDLPATIGREAMYWLNIVDYVLIIVNPDLNSLASGLKVKTVCDMIKKKVIGIVVNKSVDSRKENHDVKEVFGENANILTYIPYDFNVNESLTFCKPMMKFAPWSPYSLGVLQFASMLTNKRMPSINPLFRIFGKYVKNY